jgi:hypothetical protein
MSTKRIVAYIPEDGFIKGYGYRVSFVEEGTAGHMPTGDWPYTGAPSQKMPWFWGENLEVARQLAKEYNAKLGVSEEDAFKIVAQSIGLQMSNGKWRRHQG